MMATVTSAMRLSLRGAALALALAAGGCTTLPLPQGPMLHVPASRSVAEADSSLERAKAERLAVEAEFAASEQNCYARFFVNSCLDLIGEKRRVALARIRAIEVEAGRFKRQAAVDERDAALAKAEADFAKAEQEAAARAPAAPAKVEAASPPRPSGVAQKRQADKVAKLKRSQEREAGNAAKRAASASAYAAKQAASARRQADVAARQRASEEKARQREAIKTP